MSERAERRVPGESTVLPGVGAAASLAGNAVTVLGWANVTPEMVGDSPYVSLSAVFLLLVFLWGFASGYAIRSLVYARRWARGLREVCDLNDASKSILAEAFEEGSVELFVIDPDAAQLIGMGLLSIPANGMTDRKMPCTLTARANGMLKRHWKRIMGTERQ